MLNISKLWTSRFKSLGNFYRIGCILPGISSFLFQILITEIPVRFFTCCIIFTFNTIKTLLAIYRFMLKPLFRPTSIWIIMLLLLFSCTSGEQYSDLVKGLIAKDETIHTFNIDIENPIAPIQPTMYGIFFEDINFAGDGGVYAEMVKNRSFEFLETMMGWEQPASDRFSLNEKAGFASTYHIEQNSPNSNFLRVELFADSGYRLVNQGFRGMGFKEDLAYYFSMKARIIEGMPVLNIEFLDAADQVIAQAKVVPNGTSWNTYRAELIPQKRVQKGKLNIRFEGTGIIDLDMISLFPGDTWKNRPGGLRADLIQLLADLDPGFLRFPGGCIVEGRTLARRYQWKKTIGAIDQRESLVNRWNTEFRHRLTPDYFQSFGLGFFEYFQLAEDLRAEPLPILSCGMACQFNTGELVPMDELGPYVDDALDLIEFANGPVDSPWGKIRMEMGHPESFNLKFIGIGNEQWGPEYIKRYEVFEKAIKDSYPDIIIVSGSGPFPDGEMFEYGMQALEKLDAEIIDEHYYRSPEWFLENAGRYDHYDRKGPKIFAGEYAAQSVAIASPENKNNWKCALSEAAFMTGLERNAEVVHLTSYAPLFAHVDAWQWTPDLIWFNNLESLGTANYYVQKLFATNPGTQVLELTEDNKPIIGDKGIYATAALDEQTNELILKFVNVSNANQRINLKGMEDWSTRSIGRRIVLQHADLEAENTFDAPQNVYPEESEFEFEPGRLQFELSPQSFAVYRIMLI